MNQDITNQKKAVALLSVLSNSILIALKLIVGLLIGSVSVISEGIHSGVDLVAAVIAYFAVRQSGKPADENHHFGHGKVENISGTVEALLIFLAAGWIIVEAIKKLRHGEALDAPAWGIAVMFVSAIANLIVSQRLFRIGRHTGSVALQADAWHLRTDVYTSAGVMAGLAFIWAGNQIMPSLDLRWVDPVAALAVALLILKAAYDMTLEAGRDLLDASLPASEETVIRRHIASFSPRVRGTHRLRTRKSGHIRFIEFHIRVDADMSVEKAHQLSHEVADSIKAELPDSSVTIHIEPCKRECLPECLPNCILTEAERVAQNSQEQIGL
jgi:cation diffusion facilitator family transporter